MLKGFLFLCAVFAVVIAMSANVFAAEILFEHRERRQISRGVIYEQSRMMTSRGMLDVHVLLIDINHPHTALAPVTSSQALGRRETAARLLSDAGAVAGINADFFGMEGAYSTHFGPVARDGQLLAMSDSVNHNADEFATFFLDMHNNPFFRYVQADMLIMVNEARSVRVGLYNTIGHELMSVAVVDRLAMYDTAALDARLNNLTKIVVENDFITYVSSPGETVRVPENGYVVIIPEHLRNNYMQHFNLGGFVWLHIGSDIRVDFSQISMAIGGGAVILSRGETVYGGGVAPNARHPRSAVGATRDGSIVLMTVDGRTHSVGVTHAELASLLRRYGVYDAMHLDGGGSATMVLADRHGAHSVANTPSDGAQRRVINALGVFNTAPVGEITRLAIEAADRAVVSVPLAVNVFGEDDFWNLIPLNPDSQIAFLADPASGFWQNGSYIPFRTGLHTIEVRYGNLSAAATVYAHELAELQPRPASINTLEGRRVPLRFSGIATDGTQVDVPEVTGLSVSPSNLGFFEDGYFVAASGGAGFISAVVGPIRAYIPVSVGGHPWPVDMLFSNIGFLRQPTTHVTGTAGVETFAGRRAISLDYGFSPGNITQAAYVTFDPPLAIPGTPIALRLQAHGDGSGHWLRGRVQDGGGNFHNIDFARSADFIGWETVTAMLPDAPAPFTLDRIYMVVLDAYSYSRHTARFYGLEALYAPTQAPQAPQGTVFHDRQRADRGFQGIPGGASFQFDIPTGVAAEYSVHQQSDFAVVTMTATGGGIAAADIDQWGRFMPNIRAFNPNNVVILLDENPLNFRRRMEFELFHLAMQELKDEGRLVFVVSAAGESTALHMQDGIRYINIARPEDGQASIRFWTGGVEIWWSD